MVETVAPCGGGGLHPLPGAAGGVGVHPVVVSAHHHGVAFGGVMTAALHHVASPLHAAACRLLAVGVEVVLGVTETALLPALSAAHVLAALHNRQLYAVQCEGPPALLRDAAAAGRHRGHARGRGASAPAVAAVVAAAAPGAPAGVHTAARSRRPADRAAAPLPQLFPHHQLLESHHHLVLARALRCRHLQSAMGAHCHLHLQQDPEHSLWSKAYFLSR